MTSASFRALFLLAIAVALAACSTDSGQHEADAASTADAIPPDAKAEPDAGPDLSCAGIPTPNTAPTSIEISGHTITLGPGGEIPLTNISVELFDSADETTVLASDVSDSDTGTFSMQLPTDGTPRLASFRFRGGSDLLTLYVSLGAEVFEDIDNMLGVLMSVETFILLQSLTGVAQLQERAVVVVVVSDCTGAPLAGATVLTTPAEGTVIYGAANGVPDANLTQTSISGVVYLFNAPVEPLTLSAELDGMMFRNATVTPHPFSEAATNTVVVFP